MYKFSWKITSAATLGLALAFTFNACLDGGNIGGSPSPNDNEGGDTRGTFVDSRDNLSYEWVKIGSQTWMAGNLRFSATASDCIYYNTFEIKDYCLYTYENALCPDGWHLPSYEEWTELTNIVGSDAGTKLKSKNYNGKDSYGFTAIPINPNASIAGGWWSSTIAYKNCSPTLTNCVGPASDAYIWRVSYDASEVFKEISAFDKLNAVRCVK